MNNSDERARGTAWRIWDLHVHTPASLVQKYGGDTDTVWARFIDELEALPSDISVIGINDYWFLDGYRRVLKARQAGRLRNLEAIFPVIEMRLDQFGGTDGKLSRVNLHVIFDPDIDPDVIQAQFLGALQPRVKLAPGHDALGWQGVITQESLADFGFRIKQSVPAEQLKNFGTDMQEGFNNLNVSLSDVQEALSSQYFKGKALIGLGKTEWANIKWNEQSIAAKKHVINSADFIFTAFADASRWRADVETLRSNNVNHRLLDCSDAHYFSASDQQMRLGACQTWLNTTPTLAGLSYALAEFERRAYVGLEPPALARIRMNPEHFISKIAVKSDKTEHTLFDHDISLNTGFVAVVGNKGQGKSALLDCIALAGNSSRNREFAFLTPTRFLSPSNKKIAKNYYSELEWKTGTTRRVQLNDEHDRSAPISVEYLPQAFVERVCSIDPITGDAIEFERELRTVLFTHISEEERAGEKTFDALLLQKTRATQGEVERLRDELRAASSGYATLAEFRAENLLTEVDGRLNLKEAEVYAARTALKLEGEGLAAIDSSSQDNGELTALKQRSGDIEALRDRLQRERAANEQVQAQLRQSFSAMDAISARAEALRADTVTLNTEAELLMGGVGNPYVALTINRTRYEDSRSEMEENLRAAKSEHDVLTTQVASNDEQRLENAAALAAADSARERARQRVLQAGERVAILVGNENEDGTLDGLTSLRERIRKAPQLLDDLREQILLQASRIHNALKAQLDTVASLYEPASRFIADADVVKNAGLQFNAELRMLPAWQSVSASLDGRRSGDLPDWLNGLPHRIEDTSWAQLAEQLSEALVRLEHERGDIQADFRNPANALRINSTLEDFLAEVFGLSWLEVRFGLTGDGLPLAQLSPGQRGLVLALFYLVVDRRTTPLLLDQPEENLDNATIASKLVPAIHEAAGRRQTIVVTHNANLAIVGDADQIIHCELAGSNFTVSSGSIAELDVAQLALNVLEGTKIAFDNRRHKYEAFPELV
ncbi:chromosome segregation protein SMC [Cryobacterium sp. TMT2-17-1]|uniref:TrlF family AAA-like ATPase n=1 Tax=Cryobacterium sp. TMT2-17-1 TaxID=1259248 RepID=UPI0010690F73|nr:chromosome segregation protein SMC [Cryobacterium sp. TMT2-17-1]TFC49065.1 chromosome segregation protein SMC [Cryobacterium sp. TMT2-17-1]